MSYYLCPVCGFDELEEKPYLDEIESDVGSLEICPCFSFQFGYNAKSHIENFREKWIKNGSKWFDDEVKPKKWNLKEQLKRIDIEITE